MCEESVDSDGDITHCIHTGLVLPRYAFREALGEVHTRLFLASGSRKHQGCLKVIVAADGAFFVARVDQKLLT